MIMSILERKESRGRQEEGKKGPRYDIRYILEKREGGKRRK